jgi:hypothetical protein
MNRVIARQSPKLLREHDAQLFLDGIENAVTRHLVEIPYQEVLRRFRESDRLPIADFDLAFFVEGLFISCSCHRRIRMYFDGIDHRWFPEDDDEIGAALYCPLPIRTPSTRITLYSFSLDTFLRRHEANWLTCWGNDVATIQIVGVALAALGRHLESREYRGEPNLPAGCPLAPMDLLFCAEVLLAFARQKEVLRSVLGSSKLDW